MAESSGSNSSSFLWGAKAFLIVFLIMACLVVYFNNPADRPKVACYNARILHQIVWLKPWEFFAPDDVVTQVKHNRDINRTYNKCVNTLNDFTWLTDAR